MNSSLVMWLFDLAVFEAVFLTSSLPGPFFNPGLIFIKQLRITPRTRTENLSRTKNTQNSEQNM